METVKSLALIAFIAVFVVDLSGFIEEAEAGLGRWLGIKAKIPKPFSCSLCVTWWTGLIYLLVVGRFTFDYIAVLCLLCSFTPVIGDVVYMVRDWATRIIQKIS